MGEVLNQGMENEERKESYEAPEVTRIRLFGDEMAVTACKSTMISQYVCNLDGSFINLNQGS
jgi:hypothetical protein